MRMQTSPAKKLTLRFGALLIAAFAAAFALSGCGGSVDETLVKQAGVHGDALEKTYALYNLDVLSKSSTRDLKDINAAIAAGDLKKATAGDVRRAEDAIQSRIRKLEKYTSDLKAANKALKDTPMPDFAAGLDQNFANESFAKSYKQVTRNVERYTTADLAAVGIAFSALEKYLDFLEQWEEFATSKDVKGFQEAADASDKAVNRLTAKSRKLDSREKLSSKVKPLVDSMASAASDSSQLTTLIDDLKKDYPKSFLAVHIVEK